MAEGNDFGKMSITKFNGNDFNLWKDKITNALETLEVEDAINQDFKLTEGDENEIKLKVKKDKKARFLLMSVISDDVLRNLPRPTAKEIWTSLISKYEKKSVQSLIFLRTKLMNAKQKSNENVEEFVNRIRNIRKEIEESGNTVHDDEVAMTILRGLEPSYDVFIQCITANIEKKDLNKIIENLVSEEERRNDRRIETGEEKIFYTSRRPFNKKKDLKDIKCFNCNEYGHYAKDCKMSKKNNDNVINYANNNDASFIFQVYQNEMNSSNKWIMDSGASDHICCLKENFEFIEPYKSTVIVGDGRRLKVEGLGSVKVRTKSTNGKMIKITITKVLHVPELTNNVISIGKLVTRGFKIMFERDSCKVYSKNVTLEAKRSKWNYNLCELCTIPTKKFNDKINEEYSKKGLDFYFTNKNDIIKQKDARKKENSDKIHENDIDENMNEQNRIEFEIENGTKTKEHEEVKPKIRNYKGSRKIKSAIEDLTRKIETTGATEFKFEEEAIISESNGMLKKPNSDVSDPT